MKELRIPVQSDNYVDLSEINRDFSGIIVGYNKDKAVGYIQYSEGVWYFLEGIDWEDGKDNAESSPLDLITYLIKSKKCDNFKVIEFSN